MFYFSWKYEEMMQKQLDLKQKAFEEKYRVLEDVIDKQKQD